MLRDNTPRQLWEPQELIVSVLFADVKGFTSLSETLSPRDVQDLLNEYFHEMTEVIFKQSQDNPDSLAIVQENKNIMALKQAKASPDMFMFYAPEMNVRMAERVALEDQLRKAGDAGLVWPEFANKGDADLKW